jgi:hypothetical protein
LAANAGHDPENWKRLFRKDHAQSKTGDHDTIPWHRIMIQQFMRLVLFLATMVDKKARQRPGFLLLMDRL